MAKIFCRGKKIFHGFINNVTNTSVNFSGFFFHRHLKYFSLSAIENGDEIQLSCNFENTKGKGEKEIYIHLNVEFQRIARRGKEPFLSNQCKEIDENNRMGKTLQEN